jgi:hypothetical protein
MVCLSRTRTFGIDLRLQPVSLRAFPKFGSDPLGRYLRQISAKGIPDFRQIDFWGDEPNDVIDESWQQQIVL